MISTLIIAALAATGFVNAAPTNGTEAMDLSERGWEWRWIGTQTVKGKSYNVAAPVGRNKCEIAWSSWPNSDSYIYNKGGCKYFSGIMGWTYKICDNQVFDMDGVWRGDCKTPKNEYKAECGEASFKSRLQCGFGN